jgi:hypothetical protein
VSCAVQISNVHDHKPVMLELPALVFGACGHLEPIPVLVEARERPTISGGRWFDIVNGVVCHQNRDERWAMAHAEPHTSDRLPRWVPNR